MDNIFFLVISHKKNISVPKIKGYITIFVGEKSFIDTLEQGNYLRDDCGKDKIDDKNASFCELTALYWYWKNKLMHDEIIGFCHYRRYFSKAAWNNLDLFYLKQNDVKRILSKYDIILPDKKNINCTVAENYYMHGEGLEKDLNIIREVIYKLYPEYIDYYDNFLNSKSASYYNMFIMKGDLLDQYCKWLFDILFEAEKKIDISQYTVSQARVFGYIGELLLNVWVRYNELNVKFIPVVQSDIPCSVYSINFYKQKIKNIFVTKGWMRV